MWLHHRQQQQAHSFRLPLKEHIRKGPRRTLARGASGPIFSLNFLLSSLSACLYLASSRLPVSDLMLTNPMTSQRVDFPQMLPGFYIRLALSDICIFAHTMPQRGFLAVTVCTEASSIHFSRSGDNEWSFLL